MQHSQKHDARRPWLALAAALVMAFAPRAAAAGQSYYGADSRLPSFVGGWEGNQASPHFHGSKGFWSYPGHFYEGTGPRSDYGHSGDVRAYGRHADASGHYQAGYLIQRLFIAGEYNRPDQRLFHYRSCRGEH